MDEGEIKTYRSECPLNFALETFGDTWSLLIVRDIAFWGKRTYGEFLRSKEKIATNILAARLAKLEKEGILAKTPHPGDKRKDVYSLTEKGLDLIPIVLEIGGWSSKYDPRQTDDFLKFVELVRTDQQRMIEMFKEKVRNGGSIFAESVGRTGDK